jgi:hypothetical protein
VWVLYNRAKTVQWHLLFVLIAPAEWQFRFKIWCLPEVAKIAIIVILLWKLDD